MSIQVLVRGVIFGSILSLGAPAMGAPSDSWADLVDTEGAWILNQAIQHSSGMHLSQGESYRRVDFFVTDEFFVFELLKSQCADLNFSSDEIDIVTPEGALPEAAVGLRPLKGCKLEIFVETKNYYDHSLFIGSGKNEE